jgi:hypothetical protein
MRLYGDAAEEPRIHSALERNLRALTADERGELERRAKREQKSIYTAARRYQGAK